MSTDNKGVHVQLTSIRLVSLAALSLVFTKSVTAQSPPTDSAAPAVQPAAQSSQLPFAFSGVLYLNYQYGGPTNNQSQNRFDVDRAYLNFRASAGSRDSIRVTLDVFQQRDAALDDFYAGWAVRVKYAYL